MSSTGSKTAKLYADIAFDYNAAKSNPYKRHIEEPTFASALSDLSGQHVLDLGCGAGHYCRILKSQWKATTVRGVDVSEQMLAEAKKQEEQTPLGIQYLQQDLLSASAATTITTTFGPPAQVDLVTAQYLLPYAANKKELYQLCATASELVKPGGGRFVSIVSLCTDSLLSAGKDGLLESQELGWAEAWDGDTYDGMCVELTLFGEGRSSRVTFPNYMWTQKSIEEALKAAGFSTVDWIATVVADDAPQCVQNATVDINKTPVGVFVATRN